MSKQNREEYSSWGSLISPKSLPLGFPVVFLVGPGGEGLSLAPAVARSGLTPHCFINLIYCIVYNYYFIMLSLLYFITTLVL